MTLPPRWWRSNVAVRSFRLLLISTAIILPGWFALAYVQSLGEPTHWGEISEPRSDHPEIRAAAAKILPLHKRKLRSEEDPWLDYHMEAGQTFNAYLKRDAVLPDETRKRLVILPLGYVPVRHEKYLEETAELLSLFYNLPCDILDPVPLDDLDPSARRKCHYEPHEQLLADYLVHDFLPKFVPDDAIAVLGLTAEDLYLKDSWWAYGSANQQLRIGVWSTFRFGDPVAHPEAEKLFRRRLFKTSVHETGHMFGMPHCIAYECLMNGALTQEQADTPVHWFCPECEQKVWWGLKPEPGERYRKLAAFAEKKGLTEAADFWRNSLRVLESR